MFDVFRVTELLTGKKQRYLIIKSSALKRTFQVH